MQLEDLADQLEEHHLVQGQVGMALTSSCCMLCVGNSLPGFDGELPWLLNEGLHTTHVTTNQ